jgi:ABC-type oligopeptide transport system ATPase subunit
MTELLRVKNLCTYFPVKSGWFRRTSGVIKALDDVSFSVREQEIVGVIGESGSGKTTLAKTILRLTEPTSGTVFFESEDIMSLKRSQLLPIRKKMQVVFQNPQDTLNMRKTIAEMLFEVLLFHKIAESHEAMQAYAEGLLEKVGLDGSYLMRYPHELSIGQQQRICLARALCTQPKLILLDESTSALDISVQAQVLNLLLELNREEKVSYLFISHDIAAVRHLADSVIVMYQGKVVEYGSADTLFDAPQHPYTQKLLSSMPL